jgi:hypothetical protein
MRSLEQTSDDDALQPLSDADAKRCSASRTRARAVAKHFAGGITIARDAVVSMCCR